MLTRLGAFVDQLTQVLSQASSPNGTFSCKALPHCDVLYVAFTRLATIEFAANSDQMTANAAPAAEVAAFADRPSLTVASTTLSESTVSAGTVEVAIDLLSDSLRVVVAPGQNVIALQAFNQAHGLLDTQLESAIVNQLGAPAGGTVINKSAANVLNIAIAQRIPLTVISGRNLSSLDALGNRAVTAKAFITQAVG